MANTPTIHRPTHPKVDRRTAEGQKNIHDRMASDIVRSTLKEIKPLTLQETKQVVSLMHPDKVATLLFVIARTYKEDELNF